MSKPTPTADEGTKLTIRERIEQTRASDRKRFVRKMSCIFLPLAIIMLLLIIFWNSLAFFWVSLNIRYGDQEARISSLKILVERNDRRGRPYFIAALDGNIFERNVGLKGLRFAGDSSLCNKFETIYRDKGDTYKDPITQVTNREIAVELLAQYGGADYIEFFLSLLSEGNPWWEYGWEYLKTHATAELLPRLLEMFDSDDALDHLRAVKALYWLRDETWVRESPEVANKAASNCNHENWRVRMWSCRIIAALGGLSGKDYVPKLLEQLRDELEKEKFPVVQFIADALGEIGDARAVPELVGLLRSPDYPASSSAQIALIRIGSFTAVPGLVAVARDEELERECRVGAIHVIPRLVEQGGNAALELPEVQWALISIIRSVDPDSLIESDANLAVRIEAAKIVNCSLSGSSSELFRILPPANVLARIARAWADKDIQKAVFETFVDESNRDIKERLGITLARVRYPGLGRYLVKWAPDAHPSERKIIAEAFSILTACPGMPKGDDFGFGDARTAEEVLNSAKKAEEWLTGQRSKENAESGTRNPGAEADERR